MLQPMPPADVAAALAGRRARLIDVRGGDEFARRHVAGAENLPLDRLPATLGAGEGQIIFTCRSGQRTAMHQARLAALAPGAGVLAGGVDGWAAAGLPLVENRAAPLEIMRQVQIVAGALVLAGVLLGWLVAPALAGLAAFVGAGLLLAGATGFCGMARLLAWLPWNRALRA